MLQLSTFYVLAFVVYWDFNFSYNDTEILEAGVGLLPRIHDETALSGFIQTKHKEFLPLTFSFARDFC